jgi:uncharacterized protein YbjT (DUF2867 family)
MNRILVLGATGNIGSVIVQNLQDRKADFIAGVPAAEIPKLKRGVKSVAVDFADKSSLQKAMKGVDSLFLLLPLAAPMLGWADSIIEAADNSDIGFILRSSLLDSHPESQHALYRIHGQIDEKVRDSGIPFCIVHPNAFMQNFAVYYSKSIIDNSEFYSTNDADTKLSWVDVRDIAAVDTEILIDPEAHDSEEYMVTGPKAISFSEISRILSMATGRPIRFVKLEENQYKNGLLSMGTPEWNVEMIMSLEQYIKIGKQDMVTEDVFDITGHTPHPFEQFARDYAKTWERVLVHA